MNVSAVHRIAFSWPDAELVLGWLGGRVIPVGEKVGQGIGDRGGTGSALTLQAQGEGVPEGLLVQGSTFWRPAGKRRK